MPIAANMFPALAGENTNRMQVRRYLIINAPEAAKSIHMVSHMASGGNWNWCSTPRAYDAAGEHGHRAGTVTVFPQGESCAFEKTLGSYI